MLAFLCFGDFKVRRWTWLKTILCLFSPHVLWLCTPSSRSWTQADFMLPIRSGIWSISRGYQGRQVPRLLPLPPPCHGSQDWFLSWFFLIRLRVRLPPWTWNSVSGFLLLARAWAPGREFLEDAWLPVSPHFIRPLLLPVSAWPARTQHRHGLNDSRMCLIGFLPSLVHWPSLHCQSSQPDRTCLVLEKGAGPGTKIWGWAPIQVQNLSSLFSPASVLCCLDHPMLWDMSYVTSVLCFETVFWWFFLFFFSHFSEDTSNHLLLFLRDLCLYHLRRAGDKDVSNPWAHFRLEGYKAEYGVSSSQEKFPRALSCPS